MRLILIHPAHPFKCNIKKSLKMNSLVVMCNMGGGGGERTCYTVVLTLFGVLFSKNNT